MSLSDFSTKFAAAAVPKLLGGLAETVTYTVATTGAAVTRRMIYDRKIFAIDEKSDCFFQCSSDSTTGIASPQRGDTIVRAADTSVPWTVVDVRVDGDGMYELSCKAPEMVT